MRDEKKGVVWGKVTTDVFSQFVGNLTLYPVDRRKTDAPLVNPIAPDSDSYE